MGGLEFSVQAEKDPLSATSEKINTLSITNRCLKYPRTRSCAFDLLTSCDSFTVVILP
ncbi:13301_t:CDS:1, partial [Racocetra persica]